MPEIHGLRISQYSIRIFSFFHIFLKIYISKRWADDNSDASILWLFCSPLIHFFSCCEQRLADLNDSRFFGGRKSSSTSGTPQDPYVGLISISCRTFRMFFPRQEWFYTDPHSLLLCRGRLIRTCFSTWNFVTISLTFLSTPPPPSPFFLIIVIIII